MLLASLKRHWLIVTGACMVVAVISYGAFSLGGQAVGGLVETTVKQKGDRFAEFLTADRPKLQAFLTGIARDPDAEQYVRSMASLSGIDTFSIFNARGDEVYGSRSARHKWLLRDRPGGMTSNDRLDVDALAIAAGSQVVNDDGSSNPSVINPLVLDGRTVGYAAVTVDMASARLGFQGTIASAALHLLALTFVVGGIPGLLYMRRNRKMAEADERIRFLANHDVLTTLFNRARMQSETDQMLATSRATREHMAYFFLDIDGLADINGEYGQAQGDEVLRVVAARLSQTLGRADLLGRIAADDFVFLHRRVESPALIADLARRVTAAVCQPIEIAGGTVRPQVSIGVARMPEDGRSHSELLKHAEMALLHHKASKVGDFALYDASMNTEIAQRKQIEAMVRANCETRTFELFYQPIVSGKDLSLVGFEALLRMPDGKGGYISPTVFVPIAEARGYIKSIGTWVIEEACRQIAAWPEDLYVSVNLSTVQFRGDDLVEIVENALSAAGIGGHRLEVEIVESLVLDRSDAVLGQLQRLKALGVSVAMDDFGTGYSSLSYLWRFGFDKLKIDQSFMKAFEAGEPNVSQIVETIVAMAHQMGMSVTTEGVETGPQVDLLRRLGCDYIQGYRFGHPMPARDVAAEWLAHRAAFGVTAAGGRDAASEGPERQSAARRA